MTRVLTRFGTTAIIAGIAFSSATAVADPFTVRIEGIVSDRYSGDGPGQQELTGSTITIVLTYDPNRAPNGSQPTGLPQNNGTFAWYSNDASPFFEMSVLVGPYQGFSPLSADPGNHYVSVLDNATLRDFSGDPPWPLIDDNVDRFSFVSSFDAGESNVVDGLRLTWISFGMLDRSAAVLTDAGLPNASELTAFPPGSITFDLFGGPSFVTRTAAITSVSVVPLPAGLLLLLSGLAAGGAMRKSCAPSRPQTTRTAVQASDNHRLQ